MDMDATESQVIAPHGRALSFVSQAGRPARQRKIFQLSGVVGFTSLPLKPGFAPGFFCLRSVIRV
jgi:hypothetical protein